ncbi:MAG: hypothetical protein Q9220_004725 [cf. Caloplaca sp. 1 TL-2023]
MSFSELFSDFLSSLSLTEAHAEAPPADEDSDEKSEEGGEDKGEDGGEEEKEDEGGEEGGEDEGGDDEEEEEEEEEPEDIKPKLEAECAESNECAPLKHHFDACAQRVQQQHENENHKGPKEDCVEEFFHLSHCATQCAAPKLFRALK